MPLREFNEDLRILKFTNYKSIFFYSIELRKIIHEVDFKIEAVPTTEWIREELALYSVSI